MRIKRTRFVEDAKLDPGRYYRNPSDIIRDRRLNNKERLDIVIAWERALEGAIDEKFDQLQKLRAELEQDID